jgi:16S rRNA (guanine527-N7)-methyltransferase
MESMVGRFFPELSTTEVEGLERLESVFREWNARINLVSRKDMDAFALHHMVHSLALLKYMRIPDRARVLDVGTGGGLPGLPLAICHPRAQFFLCDSITKKANAVQDMVTTLGTKNAHVVNKRAETLESKWDFVLGRAVTSLPRFLGWIRKNVRPGGSEEFPNGILYWKGSLYQEELESVGITEPFRVFSIEEHIPDPYFAGKYIIHLTRAQALKAVLPEEETA